MDEIGLHDADDFAGTCVGGDQRIKRFGFAAQRNDQASAGVAEQLLFRMILL